MFNLNLIRRVVYIKFDFVNKSAFIISSVNGSRKTWAVTPADNSAHFHSVNTFWVKGAEQFSPVFYFPQNS